MSLFSYKAIDSKGRNQFGSLDAANENDLENQLSRMGLDLIKCKFVEEKRGLFGEGVIRRIDLINFCFHMEQLTRSGVSIIDGLVDLRDSVDQASFRRIIGQVIDDIEGGMKLSQALAEHSKVFDDMFVNLIAAGEESGQLPDVFLSLNEMIKWHDELINTTKKLLIFPAFVTAVVMGVVAFLMIYLVPQLVSFIEGIGQELPVHTKLLITTSNFFVKFWYLFLFVPLAVAATIKLLVSVNDEARYQVDVEAVAIMLDSPFVDSQLKTKGQA